MFLIVFEAVSGAVFDIDLRNFENSFKFLRKIEIKICKIPNPKVIFHVQKVIVSLVNKNLCVCDSLRWFVPWSVASVRVSWVFK